MDELEQRYSKYDQDKDYNGAVGIEIANDISQICGHDPEKIRKWITMQTIAHFREEVIQDENTH